MKNIRIFLASSKELKVDREQLEIMLSRTNEQWKEDDFSLQLDIWEKVSQRMSLTRSQDEYNKVISQVDMFVLLAQHWVGKYTAEEFDCAHSLFKQHQKPIIFTFFKKPKDKEDPSLEEFKNKLKGLEYFAPNYEHFDTLWMQVYPELERLKRELLNKGRDIETFRQELFKILDDRGFDAAPDVFMKIEQSDFEYSKSMLANLKSQANTPLSQLAPQGFLVGLRSFILGIVPKRTNS